MARRSPSADKAEAISNVVALPVVQTVPECRFPLSASGADVYDETMRDLHEHGRLSLRSRFHAEILAAEWTVTGTKMANGETVAPASFSGMKDSVNELWPAERDAAEAVTAETSKNKFAKAGVVNRKA